MSLQNLARHMEAQGRGPDRTLVHMTPKEVQGLQAIAMAHGGSLTINPVTGLPEAGFLDKFLPAIAGFALNAFAPGVGTAVGSMFGLGSAAGTALTVGGISGLASGSLEKGIMAGLGAYGGAAVGEGLGNMGQTANMKEAYDAAAASGMDSSDSFMASLDKAQPDVSKGIAAAANAPKDFLKDNKYALAALAAPALMGSQGKEPAALPSSGYIRTMKRDPVTGEIYQESATPTGEWGGRPTGTYGGVARMADGGEVSNVLADTNPDAFKQVAYDTRTDSQKALDYLMGKPGAVNPMLFSSSSSGAPLLPLDYRTRTGGKYILNAATNTYDWVPDVSSPTSSLPALNTGQGGGGGYDQPIDARTAAFFDNETKEQRDARMGQVNEVLSMLAPGALVGRALSGALSSPIAGGIANFFSPPGSQPNYSVPVDSLGTYSNNPIGQTSYESGVGNPAESLANEARDQTDRDQGAAVGGDQGSISDQNTAGDGGGYGGYGGDSAGSDSFGGGEYARGGIAALASGGLGSLGGYSDGGRLLRGPGNGTSDSIPATIGNKRPARLADGEFVIPSRIVSELGNGSTEAGARQLYAMMDRIQAARRKTVGKNKVAFDAKARKHLPA